LKHISCLCMETYRNGNNWIIFNNVLKLAISWPGLWITYFYIYFSYIISIYFHCTWSIENTQVKLRDKSIIIISSFCVMNITLSVCRLNIFEVSRTTLKFEEAWYVGSLPNAKLARMCEKYSRGLIWDTIAEFAWWDREIPRKPSIRLASHRDTIWNRNCQMRNCKI
jgi:hypothetical protein